MEQKIYNYLKEKGIFVAEEGAIATNSIKLVEDEVVLSGNRFGLIMLADYIVNVALSNVNGYHIHLDQNNFFDDGDKQLIIELTK